MTAGSLFDIATHGRFRHPFNTDCDSEATRDGDRFAFDLGFVGSFFAGMAEAPAVAESRLLEGPCFVAGTPVQMADGTTKTIEAVKVGDEVLSRESGDPDGNGAVLTRRVTRAFKHTASGGTVVLHLSDGERLRATPSHPFFIEGHGFTPAGDLSAGAHLVTRAGTGDGAIAIVERVERLTAKVTVFNFEVEGSHTYFVGKAHGGIWVHNDCTALAKANVAKYGGTIYRLTNKIGNFSGAIERAHAPLGTGDAAPVVDQFGDALSWYYHDVHGIGSNGGNPEFIRDPMMLGHNDPVPFSDWTQHYNNFDLHQFGPK